MQIKKERGVVLSSRISGEADIISTIFTEHSGKERFIFKGLKKSRKRSISSTEPGSHIELSYYKKDGNEISYVNEFSEVESFDSIRDDLSKILFMHLMAEIVEKSSASENPDTFTYRLLLSGIKTLSESENSVLVALFFTIHLIRHHGILPDTGRCSICGKSDMAEFSFEPENHTAVCRSCSRLRKKKSPFYINQQKLLFIKESLRKKFADLDSSIISEDEATELLFYLALYLEEYFHTELKSKSLAFTLAKSS